MRRQRRQRGDNDDTATIPRRQRDDNAATTTTPRRHRDDNAATNDGAKARLVVIPELQGLGLGRRLSEAVAQTFVERGVRYFSKARASSAYGVASIASIERGSARADLLPSPPSTTRVSRAAGAPFNRRMASLHTSTSGRASPEACVVQANVTVPKISQQRNDRAQLLD